MKAKRAKGPKEFDIVSLVDIVFLLIIFGLVVVALEMAPEGDEDNDWNQNTLHLTFRQLPMPPEKNLRLAVIAEQSGKSETVFFPEKGKILTMSDADWQKQQAVEQVIASIDEYEREFSSRSSPIIVRAEEDVPFRVIAIILDRASRFGDKMPGLKMALLGEDKGKMQ